MEASKISDIMSCQADFASEAADADQAYCQTTPKGSPTWLRLPEFLRPASWKDKFHDAVVLMLENPYGHQQAADWWHDHSHEMVVSVGFALVSES